MYLLILSLLNQGFAIINLYQENLFIFGFNEFISGLCLDGLIVRVIEHKK